MAADGSRLETGRIYRSASLDQISDQGLDTLRSLGIRTVIDLRSQPEIERHGTFPTERLPVRWIHVVSPFGPPTGRRDRRSAALIDHPDPMALLFRMIVTDGRELLLGALRAIADPVAPPVVFHCTSGKDRTGMLAVLIQLLAGVDLDEALVDFEHSTEAMAAAGHDIVGRYPGMETMAPEQIARISAADPAWIHAALTEIGGVEQLGSWLEANGVDRAHQANLRRHLRSD